MALTQHWPLDDFSDATGAGTVRAIVGTVLQFTNTSGISSSMLSSAGPGGQAAKCFDFSLIANSVDITSTQLTFSDAAAWSVSCFCSFSAAGSEPIFGRASQATSRLYKESDNVLNYRSGGNVIQQFTGTSMGIGIWHHILITHEATSEITQVFIDGVRCNPTGIAVDGNLAANLIGQANGMSSNNAKIAWFKVFNTDESANVQSLLQEGRGINYQIM